MKKFIAAVWAAAAGTALAQAPQSPTAYQKITCDHACLSQLVGDYMAALAKKDAATLPRHPTLRYTENNVEIPFGSEGLWATVTGVAKTGLVAADVQTGNAAWIGTAEENGRPVYLGMRMAVVDRQITEVETVVVRNTGLPLPFGDVSKVVHDATFNEILPPERRRSRERLRAVADSYFNTVELNDGIVFAPFDADCGRLENGILTTAASQGGGNAGSISPGCEAQFKLGIYRINKRIRERRYPIIDVERGVVVATGFFDHANEFDRYKLTDGREMRTALKWPNSISLVEAFRIRDGLIHRIEAVFSYVPYFMHSPFYLYPAQPPSKAVAGPAARSGSCDKACMVGVMDRFMEAMAGGKPHSLTWADRVRFTENGVAQQIGEGIWGSIRGKSQQGLRVAEPRSGNVTWYGLIHDHDAPAWAGVRLKLEGEAISEVEVIVARERNPGPFGDPKQFTLAPHWDAVVPKKLQMSRAKMLQQVEGYARSMERNSGQVHARLHEQCTRTENGMNVTHGAIGSAGIVKSPSQFAQGCDAQLRLGLYRPVDRLRGRRVLAVDEERGLVVTASVADFGQANRLYRLADGREVESQNYHPNSRELFEVFKLAGGQIEAIEAVSVDQPYRMPVFW